MADIGDGRNRGIAREVQQHAVRAEVVEAGGVEVGDRREGASAKQRNPVIIGAHVHAALIGADFRWYVIGWFGQFQHFIRRFDFRTVKANHRAPNHISLMLPAGYRPIMVATGLRRRFRSEERSVWKECVRSCRSGWYPDHKNK